jgi:tetratricopeptide (TPR) repeat protein
MQKETLKLGSLFFEEQKEETTPIRKLPFYRRPLAIAASIALIVSIGALIWLNRSSGTMSNDELFAAYYEPHSFADGVRGNEDTPNNYDKAIAALRQKDNDSAIRLLQSHLTEQPSDVKAAYALAIAFMEADPPQYGQAAGYFQFVIDDGKSLMVDKSNWYLALIYIKQGNMAAAKTQLEALTNSEDTSLAKKAEEVLEEL